MNHFFGSGLLNAIIWISLGLFVYFKNRKRHLNRKFGLFALSAAIYSLGFSLQAIAPTKVISLFWIRIILMATIFIPVFFLQMVFVATEKEINHKLLTFIYAIAIVFQIINFFTEWFASNPIPKGSFKYLFQAGFLYPALFLFFAVIVTYAFIKLYKAYHNSTGLKRIQLKYLFWAPLIGFTGGSTGFLLGYNCISLYHIISITTYAVSTYGFLIAYAILRYQLLEIQVVIRRTIVFAGLFTFVFGAFVSTAYLVQTFLSKVTSSEYLAMAVAVLIIVLAHEPLKNVLVKYTDRFLLQRKYDYRKVLRDASEGMAMVRELKRLLGLITHIISSKMRVSNVLVFLQEEKFSTEHYFLKARRGKETIQPETLNKDNPICLWLKENKKPLVLEEIDSGLIKDQMQSLNSKVIIPVFYKDNLMGFLSLGYKLSGDEYSKEDLILLSTLSSSAAVAIENTFLVKEMVEQERIKQELELGRDIQMNLLPKELPNIPTLTVDGLMLPAKEIGGDYYDFITLPKEDELAIVIGDVSGKGVAAGLLMAMAKTAIHTLSQEDTSPREVLLRTNSILYSQIGGQKFMTMLYFIYKPKEKTLYYSSAGHEHILIYHSKTDTVESIMSGGFMLGMLEDIGSYLEDHQLNLDSGDKVILYTDGVTESESPTGDRFGLERLINSFKDYSKKNASELLQTIKDQVYEFMNTQPHYDDVTLVVMEAK